MHVVRFSPPKHLGVFLQALAATVYEKNANGQTAQTECVFFVSTKSQPKHLDASSVTSRFCHQPYNEFIKPKGVCRKFSISKRMARYSDRTVYLLYQEAPALYKGFRSSSISSLRLTLLLCSHASFFGEKSCLKLEKSIRGKTFMG